jgi:hypothetical protein
MVVAVLISLEAIPGVAASEIVDKEPALAEAGHEYLFWSYGAVATFAVLHLAGLWRALRRRLVTS